MREETIIERALSYIIKIMKLKSSDLYILYREDFINIRHGFYDNFMSNEQIPFIVMYDNGQVSIPTNTQDIDFSFGKLLSIGPKLRSLYNNLFSTFGDINDQNISDDIYKKLARFEIGLRIHAELKNINLNLKFEFIINELIKIDNINIEEADLLQNGRKFLNAVKHYRDNPIKNERKIVEFKNDFLKAFQIKEVRYGGNI